MLKKPISILLLVTYLISTTELIELSKLPVLFRHYQEHKAWNNDITFFSFLVEHYAESIADNPDYDLDKKLPFKSSLNHTTSSVWVAPPAGAICYHFDPHPVEFIEQQPFAYQPSEPVSYFLSNIWQPPKSC